MSDYRVVFVCSGNICRSPLAHALLEEKLQRRGIGGRVFVESAGTDAYHVGEQADPRMRRTARAHGVIIDHPARMITAEELEASDLVVAMDDTHVRKLSRLAPTARDRIVKMRSFDPEVSLGDAPDVPDPWYGELGGFENVFAMVERSCDALVDHIEEAIRRD
ncbi:MAG: low molecular weight protein-tyrosine-phosphatase [Spirochaetales bacterium]